MTDEQETTVEFPPTVITLAIPPASAESQAITLLIQRGELAHVRLFDKGTDLHTVIEAAYTALASVEAAPPVVPEPKPEPKPAKPKAEVSVKQSEAPAPAPEPMITIQLKKATKRIPEKNLTFAGEGDDIKKLAIDIVTKLVGGNLWDGQSHLHIEDVPGTWKKMAHLIDKEMSLFSLADFI